MSLAFDGVNDEGSNANGVTNLATNTRSWAAWIYYRTAPTDTEGIDRVAETIPSVERSEFGVLAQPPGVSGWRIRLSNGREPTAGLWDYQTDLSLNTWYHICITYDQSDVGNDPVFYINGTSVTLNETATPSGTLAGGMDSLMLGHINSANYGDFIVAERAWWSSILTAADATALSNGTAPDQIGTRPVQYHRFINPDSLGFATIGDALTITGAIFAPHPPNFWSTGQAIRSAAAKIILT